MPHFDIGTHHIRAFTFATCMAGNLVNSLHLLNHYAMRKTFCQITEI
jgi:hypothetical protein